MTSSVKKQRIYVPHQLRSHPFRFLLLPICVVFSFILLWFILYPLIHVYVYKQSIEATENWFWYYWPVALLLFVLLLLFLLCIWRCTPNKTLSEDRREEEKECILNNQRNNFYTVYSETNTNIENENTESVALTDITPSKTEKLFPRCSVKRKPEKLQITKVDIHEQPNKYPVASLSPRELFFKDLLESDNKSNSSVTFNAENQPLEDTVFSALNKINCDTKKNETREYFIASVSPGQQQNYKSNIFMFVNADEDAKLRNFN